MSTFKNKIIRLLAPYQYPQIIFGREISKALAQAGFDGGAVLDCPCGNGEVSHHLSKLPGVDVTGIDLDEESIHRASINFKRPRFYTGDIFNILGTHNQYDVICLVNSLFLLPDHNRLLAGVHHTLSGRHGVFILITPNPESSNFKNFQALYPGINTSVLTRDELRTKAHEMCFNVESTKEIEFAGYYGRSELRFFSVFAPFYLRTLNFLKSLAKEKRGNYILYCLTKNYEGT